MTRLALALAVLLASLSMWIVVPAPTRRLLPLAVGAPEVSAWLLAGSLLTAALAMPGLRRRWSARAALMLAVVSGVLAARPLVQFPRVARDAEQQLVSAFGASALGEVAGTASATARTVARPAPLVVRDLFLGLPARRDTLRTAHHVRFAAFGDTTLVLNVHRPADTATYPVLVQVYGGAWQRGSPDDDGEFAADIAAQGYVVFAIDYRHAPAVWFPAPVDDVRRALAWICANAATYGADTSRLVLLGRSAGAHLAMMAAYAPDAPRVRGVISFYGPVDLLAGYREPPSPDPLDVRAVEETFLGGTPGTMDARYRAASPISLVTRPLPPTLLLYGGRDHIVEPRFGAQLARALRATGSTVVHVELPWAEHAFDAVPNGPGSQLARYLIERFLAAVIAR